MSEESSHLHACIGVDVGGTNTDAVVLIGRRVLASFKAPTTTDVTTGVRQALISVIRQVRKIEPNLRIVQVNIGTTHFVNAVLQGQDLARVSVIRLCGTASKAVPPFEDFPEDLAETIRGGVYLVNGGNQYDGREISRVSDQEIRDCAEDSKKKGVHNFVISGIFSPVDPGQENKTADLLRQFCPEASITLSHEIGHIGLVERENAAILNESLRDLCRRTLRGFKVVLDDIGLNCPFYLTQNDGSIISSEDAARFPVTAFAAGPTNSMRGAAFLSEEEDAIVVDIGGTSTDVGVLIKGFPREASAQIKVGGVRTNFRMPDVFSIGLGGGSVVRTSSRHNQQVVSVGPLSTGYILLREGLVFGGETFTATDAAVAAGLVDLGDRSRVQDRIGTDLGTSTIVKIRQMLEDCIDQVKTTKGDVPVILVGGGSILVNERSGLEGASKVLKPPHFNVANAIGAALSQISGSVDYVVSLLPLIGEERFNTAISLAEKSSCDDIKATAIENAKVALFSEAKTTAKQQAEVKAKDVALRLGADPSTLQLVEVVDIPLSYLPGHACRIKAKVIGDLLQSEGSLSGVTVGKLNIEAHSEVNIPESDVQVQKTTSTGQVISDSEMPTSKQSFNPTDNKPTIDPESGEWILSEYDIECISMGAGILGCGGGGSPYLGKVIALKKLREGKIIRVISPERWIATSDPEKDFVLSVAFMGAPVVLIEKIVSGTESRAALNCMETLLNMDYCDNNVVQRVGNCMFAKPIARNDGMNVSVWKVLDPSQESDIIMFRHVPLYRNCQVEAGNRCKFCSNFQSNPDSKPEQGKKITALMSAEIGGLNSIEPLVLGAETCLPVVDCDGMGRAFPELGMFTPFVYGKQPQPAVLADDKGRTSVVLHADSPKDLEDHFRFACMEMGCAAGLAMCPLQPGELMDKVIPYSLSRVWHLGRAILKARWSKTSPVDTIIEHQNGKLLIVGKVMNVHRDTTGGFNRGIIAIEGLGDFTNQVLKIDFQNENLIARSHSSQQILACTPDLISCVDTESGEAITTEDIRYGLRVTVLVLPSCQLMKTEVALKVVGPGAFQYNDVEYVPFGEYVEHGPVSMI